MAFEDFTLNMTASHGLVLQFAGEKSAVSIKSTAGTFVVTQGTGQAPPAPVADPSPAANASAKVLTLFAGDQIVYDWSVVDPDISKSRNRIRWLSVWCKVDGTLSGIAG